MTKKLLKPPNPRIHVILGREERKAIEAESARLAIGMSAVIRSILRQWFAGAR